MGATKGGGTDQMGATKGGELIRWVLQKEGN